MMTREELTKLTDDQGFVIYHQDDASNPPDLQYPHWNGFSSYYPYALFRVDGSFIGVAHDLEQMHRYLINPRPDAWPSS